MRGGWGCTGEGACSQVLDDSGVERLRTEEDTERAQRHLSQLQDAFFSEREARSSGVKPDACAGDPLEPPARAPSPSGGDPSTCLGTSI